MGTVMKWPQKPCMLQRNRDVCNVCVVRGRSSTMLGCVYFRDLWNFGFEPRTDLVSLSYVGLAFGSLRFRTKVLAVEIGLT